MSDLFQAPQGFFDFLRDLFKQLKKPALVFAIAVIVVLAVVGAFIPSWAQVLVYIVVIGGMATAIVYMILEVVKLRRVPPESMPRLPEEKGEQERPPVHPGPSGESRRLYLEFLVCHCRQVRLVGLDPRASDPTRGGLRLEKVYVSLDTLTPVEKEPGGRRKIGEVEPRHLSALEALANAPDRRMVLLGLPGSGKSTFIRYLSLCMAQALLDPAFDLEEALPDWRGQPLLPVIIPLGRLAASLPAEAQQGEAAMVEGYLRAVFDANEKLRGFADILLRELDERGDSCSLTAWTKWPIWNCVRSSARPSKPSPSVTGAGVRPIFWSPAAPTPTPTRSGNWPAGPPTNWPR